MLLSECLNTTTNDLHYIMTYTGFNIQTRAVTYNAYLSSTGNGVHYNSGIQPFLFAYPQI
jgi:hypothetical protein